MYGRAKQIISLVSVRRMEEFVPIYDSGILEQPSYRSLGNFPHSVAHFERTLT